MLITNAQHWYAQLIHRAIWLRICYQRLGIWIAGQDYAFGVEVFNCSFVKVKRMHFTIHTRTAHFTRNELGIFAAKVENQNTFGVDVLSGHDYVSLV